MIHVDLYGLFSSDDAKQSAIGSVHGVGEFGINTASFLSKVGWGLSTPVRAVSWMTGRSSFSQDWGAFQRSNAAFHAAGDRWMHRVLPGDPNNKYYGMFRGGVNDGLEMGTLALGGFSFAKGLCSMGRKGVMPGWDMVGSMQKVSRPAAQLTRSDFASLRSSAPNLAQTPATSSMNAHLLKNKLIAEEISGGHAFEKHILNQGEFPGWIRTRNQLSQHIQGILNNPSVIKELRNNRTAYWQQQTGTVVIRNPSALDGGTVFQPKSGYEYFLKDIK